MARLDGAVTVALDGVTYTLRIDMNALCVIEDAKGGSAFEFLERLSGGKRPSAADMRLLVLACLQDAHPEADARLAGRILSAQLDIVGRLLATAAVAEDPENPTPAAVPPAA